MASLSDGARQLPLRHLSIRVPWHDTGWTGCICKSPAENISCLILPRISENRKDDAEGIIAGKPWHELDKDKLPPCAGERGIFMSPQDFTRELKHPYSKSSKSHEHMLPTPFRLPRYAAACLPFAWMLKEAAEKKAEDLQLGFKPELESQARELMGFPSIWVQTKQNQLVMLDTFFSAIQPKKSLCFFYAKRTPLVEDSRRVIIGAGWVEHVGDYVEYNYSGKGGLDSVIWERAVQHSIRPKLKDGFLLPYHEILEYLKEHQEDDPADFVAFVPDEHFSAFSYASEHVTNDGAIAALLSCNKALENIKMAIDGPWSAVQGWIDARLNELWKMRGPCPGLGAALCAFGMDKGNLLAFEIENLSIKNPERDPWVIVDKLLRDPSKQPKHLSKYIQPAISRKWQALPAERMKLLKLLSRFELTNEQAACYYVNEDKRREYFRISVTDSQIIKNPYLLFEQDRVTDSSISLTAIDRGAFPSEILREKFPLPEPSAINDPLDERRVRAFTIQQLERAANSGHTLLPREDVIRQIRELEIQPACPVDADMMALAEKIFDPVIAKTSMADGKPAYQVMRLKEIQDVIRQSVLKRLKGKRHEAKVDWRAKLDDIFDGPAIKGNDEELAARQEKAAALAELYASRVSVLIGPAGTGKTTLLKVLCNENSVKAGGVLALAPTGKARVRFERATQVSGAKTIAQFLVPLDRYEPKTGAYGLSKRSPEHMAKTVIIDEASMLTEEQLAAILDALAGVERLVLVGDPRQLPPIGAGRPFLDIVEQIQPDNVESLFPKVAGGYAELTVRRRQVGHSRDDLLFAEWFSGRQIDAGADEIWTKIAEGSVSDNLRFVEWKTSQELQEKLLQAIAQELRLKDINDVAGFEMSLGGTEFHGSVYFQCGRSGKGGACEKIEDWQILSPVRNAPHGVVALNRLIQMTFRQKTKELAERFRYRVIPKPMGREGIVYGDKVINLINHRHKNVYPSEGALGYVANGEIGIVVGQYKGKNSKITVPKILKVEFSSQPSFSYDYFAGDFGEEADPKLELAYALTIHKVQGSEFKLAFLIIPNPCRLLSRELLYTALTRQHDRVVIFHQGGAHELKRFASDYHSEAAQRLTNLFVPSSRSQLNDRFLEDRLIHRTRRGESVRSKSEVIIADLLYSKKIDYSYEARLVGKDGATRFPDFSFEDAEAGLKIYWEHLGMMKIPEYRERWERKLAWYRDQGIFPFDDGDKGGSGGAGVLILSRDDESGGIHSDEIEALLNRVLSS